MTALLWRDIESIGRLAVVMLWVVLLTVGWVIVAGPVHLLAVAGVRLSAAGLRARTRTSRSRLGAAAVLAMYSYGGYNQVCNIGEEIRDPAPHRAALDPAVDLHRRRALHGDEHRHPRA